MKAERVVPRSLSASIIVPSFNQVEYLSRTLDSILVQDYRPLEIVVIDGGSTDGSVDVLKDYASRYPEIRWLSEPDNGPADAVNKGLARAQGDFIGIQSSDDIYYAGALAEVAKVFSGHPDVGFVYGDVEGIDAEDRVLYRRSLPDFSWQAFFGVSLAIPQGSIFFRKSLADTVGGWNGAYYSCDIDYWLRMIFRTRVWHVRRPLSGWRLYPGQRTGEATARKIWDGYWAMIDESPDIAMAPAKIRRLAKASKHILAMRYPPVHSRWLVWRHLLVAACLHPTFWWYNPRSLYLRWIPGFGVLQGMYARLRYNRRLSDTAQ